MMDDLILQLTTKLGMNDAEARAAIKLVVEFVEIRLPTPMAKQMREILEDPSPENRNRFLNEKLSKLDRPPRS
jgi:hypothetical protein